jgi:hypothetical protein
MMLRMLERDASSAWRFSEENHVLAGKGLAIVEGRTFDQIEDPALAAIGRLPALGEAGPQVHVEAMDLDQRIVGDAGHDRGIGRTERARIQRIRRRGATACHDKVPAALGLGRPCATAGQSRHQAGSR